MASDPSSLIPIPRHMAPLSVLPDGQTPEKLEVQTGQIGKGTTLNTPPIESPPQSRYRGGTVGSPLPFQMLDSEFPAMGATEGLAGAAEHPAKGTQLVGKAKMQTQHAARLWVAIIKV
jgi:hypothetical protein